MTETPISSPWCLGCGTRFETLPIYCPNEIQVGDRAPQRCPGPPVQFFAIVEDLPTMDDVTDDILEAA